MRMQKDSKPTPLKKSTANKQEEWDERCLGGSMSKLHHITCFI